MWPEDFVEKEIYSEENRGGFRISVVARLSGPGVSNIQYRIRLADPENPDFPIDYMPTLGSFERIGALLLSLGELAKKSIYVQTPQEADTWVRVLEPRIVRVVADHLRSQRTGIRQDLPNP